MFQATFAVDDVRQRGTIRPSIRIPGYRGIWYTLGKFEYGPKYSGGLGTYTANHLPMAVYSSKVNRTFFTYGGTTGEDKRELVIMVSSFDHTTGTLPQPVALYFDPSVDDPHDNASIRLDEEGHLWLFKSGRGVHRPGIIFRSVEPFSLDAFEIIDAQEFTYPQIHQPQDGEFFLLFSKYSRHPNGQWGRNLFWKKSRDGRTWTVDEQIAAFGGHYQTSGQWKNRIATFFNWHPDGDFDQRTNLYYLETTDEGRTWTAAGGVPVQTPLTRPDNSALVRHYQAQGRCMYTCDLNFDQQGNPVLLCIVSRRGEPGPAGGPREWTVLHWNSGEWHDSVITTSDHNYDMGSLYIQGDDWTVIGPTETAPQKYGTGGEIALWHSADEGRTWERKQQITNSSPYNHSYARRPHAVNDPFYCFWADGDPTRLTRSSLYFSDSTGRHLFRLPYDMPCATAVPEKLSP